MLAMSEQTPANAADPQELDHLFMILGGHIYFQTLSAAVRFDLFGLLKREGELTRSEIAEQLGIEEQPARILLLGCTTLKLICKAGSHYSNTDLANRYLVRDEPNSMVPIALWQHFINYRPMSHFYDAIKANQNVGLDEFEGQGDTLYQRLAHSPRLEKIFQDAMESISVQANVLLAEHVDFAGVTHLLDVGGGNSANIQTLANKYPDLRATVFDSPSVCQIALKSIEAAGMSDRLNAVTGDCFRDAFPTDADCILFSHFFTIWSEENNRMLLEKSYAALPPGGRVIVFNMMQWDDENGPLSAAWGSPYFLTLATGEGMLYTAGDYEQWLRDAGFTSVSRQTLPVDHAAIIGVKG